MTCCGQFPARTHPLRSLISGSKRTLPGRTGSGQAFGPWRLRNVSELKRLKMGSGPEGADANGSSPISAGRMVSGWQGRRLARGPRTRAIEGTLRPETRPSRPSSGPTGRRRHVDGPISARRIAGFRLASSAGILGNCVGWPPWRVARCGSAAGPPGPRRRERRLRAGTAPRSCRRPANRPRSGSPRFRRETMPPGRCPPRARLRASECRPP